MLYSFGSSLLLSPVHLRLWGERGKKNLLSGKFSFCSSASVDFCLFALSSGGEGEVVTEELSLD
jgi:hypothetical protein